MKILVLLTGLILSVASYAQQPGGNRNGGNQMTGRFYGRIVDAANKGVEAASVVLVANRMDTATKQRKEVVVGGMLTAANGDFSIENVPVMAQYKLRITGIGYKKLEQTVAFERPTGGGDPSAMMGALDKDLGNIKIQIDEQVLANVTVTADKPILQLGIDRKVFNVDKNITSTGGTAVDVMKNVPSVNVDVDGNVTLRNNAPQIFVDGRPTNLTLEQIPADAIESVEIITNPSAKFDASGGTAGILNIVLKKQKRVGYAGNLRANIDSRAKFGLGGDVNIRQDKVNFFANGNFNQRKSISEGTSLRTTTYTGLKSITDQRDENTMEGQFGFGRAGIDYFINNRNTITIGGSLARGRMSPDGSSIIGIDKDFNSGPDSTWRNLKTTNSDNIFRNWGSQMSFKHNFPKAGNEWTADITVNKGRNENDNFSRTDTILVKPTATTLGISNDIQQVRGENTNMIFQTDYANPISANSKFEIGARASIRNIKSNTQYTISKKDSTSLYTNEDRVYAAYATFSNRIKTFGYQLGLRAESAINDGVLNEKQSFKTEFPISFFPSVFLSQKLSDYSDMQLNYSRRINRPNFFQLFPYTDYTDISNVSRGNPDLKPEFTNSLELSFSKVFKKNRDNFIASLYFKNTNDLITRYQFLEFDKFLDSTVIISSYINANKSYVTGLELTSRNKITKFWDLTSNINFFTAKIDVANQPDQDQFLSYFLKLSNSFKLPKNFSVQLSGDYTSKIISSPGGSGNRGGGGGMMMMGGGGGSVAQGFIRPNYGIDGAIRYEFLKNKTASLSLNVQDIFRTKKYDAHSESAFFVQDITRRRDAQVFRLNFNYRFGKFDATLFKRKNTKAEGNLNTDMGI
jgi:outer membrane receptor protein involved in Fe transport